MRELKPKKVRPVAHIALKLKEKGYDVIPLKSGKEHPFKGWPEMPNDPADIVRWSGKAAAVRMKGTPTLLAIDMDVGRADLRDKVLDKWMELWPTFMHKALRRNSGRVPLMLFGRVAKTERKNPKSSRWGKSEEHPKGHMVEVFTSNAGRYVAVWGAHSEGREYAFEGTPLWEVAVDDLPEFSDADIPELLAIVDEVMQAEGLEKDETAHGESTSAFDLTPDMQWMMEDGSLITLREFCDIYADSDWQAGYANLWDDKSNTATRVKARVTASGITLWDSKTEINHHFEIADALTPELVDGLKTLAAANPAPALFNSGYAMRDFWAYLPTHQYIFATLGTLWPIASINAILPRVTTPTGVELKASTWLDQNQRVGQMIWAPGLPQIIEGMMLSEGGWVEKQNEAAFNSYRPPIVQQGDAREAARWLDLLEMVYPDDAAHIVAWFAHRVQRPYEKINHALVLVGAPGIGKDTLIEPLRYAIGAWNFQDISPHHVMEKWNDYMAAVVVRISEARDLGDINRYMFYEKTKTMMASPPDTVRVDAKYRPQIYALNVAGVLITTNHRYDGLYLPPNDRRHYVAGSDATAADITRGDKDYWNDLWRWYHNGGFAHVAEYLLGYDLHAEGFDPKAPPLQTDAFKSMVSAGIAPEVAELGDVITKMGNPAIVTLDQLRNNTGVHRELHDWLNDRKNRRAVPHRLEAAGYIQADNPGRADNYWVVNGIRQVLYGRVDASTQDRTLAARDFVQTQEKIAKQAGEAVKKLRP